MECYGFVGGRKHFDFIYILGCELWIQALKADDPKQICRHGVAVLTFKINWCTDTRQTLPFRTVPIVLQSCSPQSQANISKRPGALSQLQCAKDFVHRVPGPCLCQHHSQAASEQHPRGHFEPRWTMAWLQCWSWLCRCQLQHKQAYWQLLDGHSELREAGVLPHQLPWPCHALSVSAPFCNRVWTTLTWSLLAATCKGVGPVFSLALSMIIPASISALATSALPFWAAMYKAFAPSTALVLPASAPFSISKQTTSMWPCWAAMNNGVAPSVTALSMSTPAATSKLTILVCPCRALPHQLLWPCLCQHNSQSES